MGAERLARNGAGCSLAAIASLLFAATTGAELTTFVDSTGRAETVDLDNPGLHGLPAGPPQLYAKAGTVTFAVYFQDVTNYTGIGFDDPARGAERRARVMDAVDYLGLLLSHPGRCDILFRISETDGSGVLAYGGTHFLQAGPLFTNGFAYSHITTGVDPSISVPDIELTFDFGFNWYDGPNYPGGSQLDLTTAVLHEISHGMGLLSLTNETGASIVANRVMSVWDNLIYNGDALKLWDGTTAQFAGTAGDLLGANNGVKFQGPTAMTVFGVPVPVYAPATFASGLSISHWDPTGVAPAIPVLKPALFGGEWIRMYSDIDLAALTDIGYLLNDLGFIFVEEPLGGTYEEGRRVEMRVRVVRTVGPVTYQWLKDGAVVPGETSDTIVLNPVLLGHQGSYSCRVSDTGHTKDSASALLTIQYAGTLPATGIVGLCIVAAVCMVAGAFIIFRR